VTDPSHWPGTSQDILCWLQISRANAQSDSKAGREFSIPPALLNTEMIEEIAAPFEKQGYDLSACQEE